MKRKDIVYLVVAAVIFSITGIVAFNQFGPKTNASKTVQVEVVTPIQPNFDSNALNTLTDPNTARNFTPNIDFSSGLGNTKPFNPI